MAETSNPDTPPPDFVGYDNLIAFVRQRALYKLEGDLIEIGAFMGGGTVKLAKFARDYGKKVFVVDIFEPALDQTLSPRGTTACDVYLAFLEGRSMIEVYREATRDFDNIVTIREDSKKVRFGKGQKFCFGFIDGCHQEAFVLSDFAAIWPNLVSGGALGFHDWEFADWPEVTTAVKSILAKHKEDIAETAEIECGYNIRSLMLIKK
ncbi:MAG: class I SAM-dependent methyltransferase [Chloroflexi bacterium]|nr:class I SAM-dependent methyltransferase [Chloroflexota bacterium]